MFNYDLLITLIKIAKGDRGLNKFCRDAGLEQSNISRLLNRKNTKPPKPEILLAIANNSDLKVSYNELLLACGYLETKKDSEEEDYSISLEKELSELKKKLDRVIYLTNDNFSKDAFDKLMEIQSNGISQTLLLSRARNELK